MPDEPVKIDLTHAFNRLADQWFDLFKGTVATHMPHPACAMPGNFDEATIQRVNNEGTHTNWFLRWNQTAKATDSMWETRRLLSSITWDLHVSWDGVAFEQENEQYHLGRVWDDGLESRDQRAMVVLRQMTFFALDHRPEQRNRAPVINDTRHQDHAAASGSRAI